MIAREQLVPGQRFISIPDYDGVLSAIKRYGVFSFGGTDGCLCSHFELRGIHVDISCRKSSGPGWTEDFFGTTVRVYCHYLYSGLSDLLPIAREVVSQVQEIEGHLPVMVRLCEFQTDHGQKGEEGARCVHCGAERDDRAGYLCAKCISGVDSFGSPIVEQYTLPSDWTGLFPAILVM